MKNTQNEQWLEIENSGGIYQISNTGRILSFRGKTPRYLKPQVNNYGHKIVFLKFSNDFSAHTMVLSRLVAKAFVENPHHYKYIRFKDGNKLNCNAENLEWVRSTDGMKKLIASRCRKVHQYALDGTYIRTWNSVKEAEENVEITGIAYVCNKGNGAAGGFTWRFSNGTMPELQIPPPDVRKRKVVQYSLKGEYIRTWSSHKEASLSVGISNSGNISKCCNGKRHQASGYIWRYEEKI